MNYLNELSAEVELNIIDRSVTIVCFGSGAKIDLSDIDLLYLSDLRKIVATMNRLKKAYKAAEELYQSEYGD